MARTPEATNGGIGIAGLLFITFLVLKLCGVITWSWWWVTAPLWLWPSALIAGAAVLCWCAVMSHSIRVVLSIKKKR